MGQVGVFSRGQILAAGELALYSDGGSGWGMAASATAPMWDTWNQQAKRSAAGPSAHAHYLPAPSGHLYQCFSPGVLLEPEDSYLGCKQLSLWLIQPHVPPAISLVLPPDPPPPRHGKPFLVWGNPTPSVFLPQIPSPLPFSPTAKPLRSLNREFQNTEVKKNFWLFLLPSLPKISLRQ